MRDRKIKLRPSRFQFFLFLLSTLLYFSVQEVSAQKILEINDYVESSNIQSSDPFMDLRYGSDGIIEFAAGKTVFPKNPNARNLVIASADLRSIQNEADKFGSVQFMQINLVAGRTFSLNYTQLADFHALRFILIVSPDQLSEGQFSQMLTGFEESGIVLLYQISRPG